MNDNESTDKTGTIRFTWKNLCSAGLLLAAEYEVLALIEDAPAIIKGATVVCDIAALAVMQFETGLRQRANNLYAVLLSGVFAFYLAFIAYAMVHTYHQSEMHDALDNYYIASGELYDEVQPFLLSSDAPPKETIVKWRADIGKWRDDTAQYIDLNLGAADRDRFLDAWTRPAVASSGWPEVDAGIAYLSKLRANLNVIRDSVAK
jgi:hypothetical protein